jgi:ABC-type amino acid transport substrate-binding protein
MRPRNLSGALALLLLCLAPSMALAHENVLDQVRRFGTIRLGYYENALPFSGRRGDGTPEGYSVDLCARIAEGLGRQLGKPIKVEWKLLTLADRFDALAKGRVDMECGTTTWTLGRQAQVDFSLMTFVDGGSILVANETDLFGLADFAGKRIAVVKGTTTERSLVDALKLRGLLAEVRIVATAEEGIALLASGEAQGFASDRVKLLGLALNAPRSGIYRIVDEDVSMEPYALALRPGDPAFRLAVNRELAALYRSGRILEVYDRWLGPLGKPSVLLSALYFLQRIPE